MKNVRPESGIQKSSFERRLFVNTGFGGVAYTHSTTICCGFYEGLEVVSKILSCSKVLESFDTWHMLEFFYSKMQLLGRCSIILH